jgi:hypothetical protein
MVGPRTVVRVLRGHLAEIFFSPPRYRTPTLSLPHLLHDVAPSSMSPTSRSFRLPLLPCLAHAHTQSRTCAPVLLDVPTPTPHSPGMIVLHLTPCPPNAIAQLSIKLLTPAFVAL